MDGSVECIAQYSGVATCRFCLAHAVIMPGPEPDTKWVGLIVGLFHLEIAFYRRMVAVCVYTK